jgi:hypothetical protein
MFNALLTGFTFHLDLTDNGSPGTDDRFAPLLSGIRETEIYALENR